MTRGRRGYKTETLLQDTIFDFLPLDYSGTTWNKLWSNAQAHGIKSKQTLSKYLVQLENIGLALKENGMYRRNPTYGNKMAEGLRNRMRLKGADSWSAKIRLTFHGNDAETTVEKSLVELIRFAFDVTLANYVEALRNIAKARNEATAREIMDIFLKSETFQLVMTARQVYDFRGKADFDKLKRDPKFLNLLGGSPPFGIDGIFGGPRKQVNPSKLSRGERERLKQFGYSRTPEEIQKLEKLIDGETG